VHNVRNSCSDVCGCTAVMHASQHKPTIAHLTPLTSQRDTSSVSASAVAAAAAVAKAAITASVLELINCRSLLVKCFPRSLPWFLLPRPLHALLFYTPFCSFLLLQKHQHQQHWRHYEPLQDDAPLQCLSQRGHVHRILLRQLCSARPNEY